MPARAIQGDHQLRAKPLVERMESDERLELADRLGLPADGEHRFEPRLQRLESESFEPRNLRLYERLRCEIGERRSSPECERACEH